MDWVGDSSGQHCMVYRCSICGYGNGSTVDHNWGEWVVTTPATTTSTGVRTRTCQNIAAHKQTETIPKLTATATPTPAPTVEFETPATCVTQGTIYYSGNTYERTPIDPNNHKGPVVIKSNASGHWYYCEACGKDTTRSSSHIDSNNDYICDVCKYSLLNSAAASRMLKSAS